MMFSNRTFKANSNMSCSQFFSVLKLYIDFIMFISNLRVKMHEQEILPIDRNAFDFFCDYEAYVHKKFKKTFVHETH